MAIGERIPGQIKIYKSATVQVGTTDTVVYTPTTGRKFYLVAIILSNTGASAETIDIYDGPSASGVRPVAPIIVPNGATITISENVLQGVPVFENDVTMKGSAGTTWVTIIGYEE